MVSGALRRQESFDGESERPLTHLRIIMGCLLELVDLEKAVGWLRPAFE
jgi:hypothetical protein